VIERLRLGPDVPARAPRRVVLRARSDRFQPAIGSFDTDEKDPASDQSACLLAFAASLLPGLGGCGSSDSSGGMIQRDEVKVKAEQQQTAEAFKEFQKTHKSTKR